MLNKLISELSGLKNPKQAKLLQRFFKTGKGEYGEGDIFLGIKVPVQREIAKRYSNLSLKELQSLISSKIHEHRMTALFILMHKYKKSDNKKEIFEFYIKNAKNINNWDLVDLSAPTIVGEYLSDKNRKIIYQLAKSSSIWEKRISVLSTFKFISKNDFADALKISELLLKDKHDLIHKAVGWMLREIGKRDLGAEEKFLDKHAEDMPRTMLRYAIEKFEAGRKSFYMNL